MLPCDVAREGEVAAVFDQLGQSWGGLDFVVHALAFSDKEELKGRYLDTSRANFARTLEISCFSFTEIARRAAPLMGAGGSLLTLTYLGAERVTPNYNVMGVAKAALETSVRYLAVDLGERGIRVNAISAGPMRTLAGAAIADARFVYRWSRDHAPLARNVLLEEVGRGVTGEIVDRALSETRRSRRQLARIFHASTGRRTGEPSIHTNSCVDGDGYNSGPGEATGISVARSEAHAIDYASP